MLALNIKLGVAAWIIYMFDLLRETVGKIAPGRLVRKREELVIIQTEQGFSLFMINVIISYMISRIHMCDLSLRLLFASLLYVSVPCGQKPNS